MSLVLQVCRYIYVLDFGELIFEGDPDDVVNSPLVKAAYLGDDAVEAQLPHAQQGIEVP
jgi:ABC-type branched-subunit amino acid transport system ATPase component